MSHACCGEPEPKVGARPHGGAPEAGGMANSAAKALALAAAPIFALLALRNALSGGQPDVLCMGGMRDVPSLNGMTLMYALMSAFHATPWLRLLSRR